MKDVTASKPYMMSSVAGKNVEEVLDELLRHVDAAREAAEAELAVDSALGEEE